MKLLVLITLLITICFSVLSQSFPADSFPDFSQRPAFKLEEEFDIDSEYPQKTLLKSYLKYYLHGKASRLAMTEYLELQFNTRSVFNKKSFDLFKFLNDKRSPKIENDLSFENQAIDFANFISYDFGFCMGVTSILRKFNMLAHFDPTNENKARVPFRQVDEKKWRQYYQKLIDNIMSNKPTIIPHFRNLEEFSEYGMFYTYLQRHAIDQWALNNMSIRAGLGDMLLGIKAKPNRLSNYLLYKKLKSRLALHYNPKVFLAKPGSFKKTEDIWIHVAQVYKVSKMKSDGSYTIYLWDPNFPASHDYAKGIVKITSKGEALFMSEPTDDSDQRVPEKLARINIYKFDDAEIAQILLNYQPFCKKHPNLCK